MKLNKYFFLFCLLTLLFLAAKSESGSVDLTNLSEADLNKIIAESLHEGFAIAADGRNKFLVRRSETCDIGGCVPNIMAHTLRRASFEANSLSLCQGQGMLQASLLLHRRLNTSIETVQTILSQIDLTDEMCQDVQASCIGLPQRRSFSELSGDEVIPKCGEEKYREINGFCNNLKNLEWGNSMQPFSRLLPADYDDEINSLRGSETGDLPTPRNVSRLLMGITPSQIVQTVSQMTKLWGQFLDHDLTRTPESSGGISDTGETLELECCEDGKLIDDPLVSPECQPLMILEDDEFFTEGSRECLRFVRSAPADTGCMLGPREQMNEVTSFIDGSNIYGSTEQEETNLRSFVNGKLRHSSGSEVTQEFCSVDTPLYFLPAGDPEPVPSFLAGDVRVDEQPSLAAMHTIWLRLHNAIANLLQSTNEFNDEVLFQETRRIVIALLQHITYNEFLPVVIGEEFMHDFDLNPNTAPDQFNNIYDSSINPAVFNVFAAAAFRFGHTLVDNKMGGIIPFTLEDKFFRASILLKEPGTHPSSIIEKEARTQALPTDSLFDAVLTEKLLLKAAEDIIGDGEVIFHSDLMALNIKRGRDHGILSYSEWRNLSGIPEIEDFDNLHMFIDSDVAEVFRLTYKEVEDIDLFPAAMAENPADGGGILGPTFSFIIARQFHNLKYGDRFFYENSKLIHKSNRDIAFTAAQLKLIKSTTLADLLCEVTCARSYPKNVFKFSTNPNNISCHRTSKLFKALEHNRWFKDNKRFKFPKKNKWIENIFSAFNRFNSLKVEG